jgi:hypothetical protein
MDHVDEVGVQARQGILEPCEGCQQDLGSAALYGRVQGFRISVAAAGVPERAIMAQTGHKRTDTLRKYIRLGSLFRENAAAQVGL